MSRLSRIFLALGNASRFVHLPVLPFTVLLPLMGASTVTPVLTSRQVLVLLTVATTFHVFAYVQNDVLDLQVDTTHPLRTKDPLVRGAIPPSMALSFATVQAPVGIVLTAWLRPSAPAFIAIGTAFALVTVYNVWGKRCIIPQLTDVIQGLSCAALVLYGSLVVHGDQSVLIVPVLAFVVLYIVMVNGVHASLRDLTNDAIHRARTTPLSMGVGYVDDKTLVIPTSFKAYVFSLQCLLTAIALYTLMVNWFGYSGLTWTGTRTIGFGTVASSVALLGVGARKGSTVATRLVLGRLHVAVTFLSVVVVLIPHLTSALLVLVVSLCAAPFVRLAIPHRHPDLSHAT